jgi:hypothetical protein
LTAVQQELTTTKQQLEELPRHQLHAEIEQLKEGNRLLLIKSREEQQKLQEEISALKYRDESQSRRLQEKQARIDELEAANTPNETSVSTQQQRQFPTALELLNKLLKRRKKSTVREVDIEIILEILGGENNANLS